MFLMRVFQNERFNWFLRVFASLIDNDGTLRKCYLFSYRYKNVWDIGLYLKKKKALSLIANVFSTKVLIGDTIFYVCNWRRDRHFTWSSEPREGPAACSAKGVPSFLAYFKTLSILRPWVSAPGIEPATSRSAVNTLYRLS